MGGPDRRRLAVAGLTVFLVTAGLGTAGKVGGAVTAAAALAALVAPYLLPAPHPGPSPGSPVPPGAAAPPPSSVDLREARGVQVNKAGGNTQVNTFTEPP